MLPHLDAPPRLIEDGAPCRYCSIGPMNQAHEAKKTMQRESVLFLLLLLTGLLVLPIAVYIVGNAVFGDYSGAGFGAFYASLHEELRRGSAVVWLLVLSPYLVWQTVRLSVYVFRHDRPQAGH